MIHTTLHCVLTDLYSISGLHKPTKKSSKPVMLDLDIAVQGLLFPTDGEDRIASEDSDLFEMVMTGFNKFEIQVVT